jgi:glycosyltransferase involved in cell wall biosynthesis
MAARTENFLDAVPAGNRANRRILFLSWWNPWPPDTGAKVRVLSLLKALALHCKKEVDLVSFAEPGEQVEDAARYLGELGIQSCFVRHSIFGRTRFQQLVPRLAAAVVARPYNAYVSRVRAMGGAVSDALDKKDYDIIIAETPYVGQFVVRRKAHAARLLSLQNVDFEVYRRRALSERNIFLKGLRMYNYWTVRRFELETVKGFDAVLVVSQGDKQLLLSSGVAMPPVHVLPLSIDTDYHAFKSRNESARSTILFVGTMFYQPNVEAVLHFYQEIYGLVKAQVPGVRFVVVGKDPADSILRLGQADSSVVVTGTVADVRPYYNSCSVFVAPIHYGGGVKTKILEAMAGGIPVVATSAAMEGIAAEDGVTVSVKDSPHDFADTLVELLKDPGKRGTNS